MTRKLERVHTDIWGPSLVLSITGSRYILTLMDDYTRKAWTYFLRRRSDFLTIFKEWRRKVENEFKEKIVSVRCDGAGEYVKNKMKEWTKEAEIALEPIVPYTSEQND